MIFIMIIMSALFSASPTLQKCTTRKKAQDSQCSTVVFAINDSRRSCKLNPMQIVLGGVVSWVAGWWCCGCLGFCCCCCWGCLGFCCCCCCCCCLGFCCCCCCWGCLGVC